MELAGEIHAERCVQPLNETYPSERCMFLQVGQVQVINVNLGGTDSWRWLKLPPGMTKKRRDQTIHVALEHTLNLTAEVVRASGPQVPVVSCLECCAREEKNFTKREGRRARFTRADPEFRRLHTRSIIHFHCEEVLACSTGSAALPLSITCPCLHHQETVGFLVCLTLRDQNDGIIWRTTTPPLMITNGRRNRVNISVGAEPGYPQVLPTGTKSTVPHRHAPPPRVDGDFANMLRGSTGPSSDSIESSASSSPLPSTTDSSLPITRPPTPPPVTPVLPTASKAATTQTHSQTRASYAPAQHHPPQSPILSSRNDLLHQIPDMPMPPIAPQVHQSAILPQQVYSPHTLNLTITHVEQLSISPSAIHLELPSPTSQRSLPQAPSPAPLQVPATPLPGPPLMTQSFPVAGANQGNGGPTFQIPTIRNVIPTEGPTYGGIDVTILGANFHPGMNLKCTFGDIVSAETCVWSDNTLVCKLPSRVEDGTVAVWFEGIPQWSDLGIFQYVDRNKETLFGLALKVIMLRFGNRRESLEDFASRIIYEDTINGGLGSHGSTSSSMQPAPSFAPGGLTTFNRDPRSLLLNFVNRSGDLESGIIDFLDILGAPLEPRFAPNAISTVEALSHTTTTGQTLLHLAAFMKLPALTNFLVEKHVDVNAKDRNGSTPLHFAILSASVECGKILVQAGADRGILDLRGKTAEETAPPGFFDNISPRPSIPSGEHRRGSDSGSDGDIKAGKGNDIGVEPNKVVGADTTNDWILMLTPTNVHSSDKLPFSAPGVADPTPIFPVAREHKESTPERSTPPKSSHPITPKHPPTILTPAPTTNNKSMVFPRLRRGPPKGTADELAGGRGRDTTTNRKDMSLLIGKLRRMWRHMKKGGKEGDVGKGREKGTIGRGLERDGTGRRPPKARTGAVGSTSSPLFEPNF